MTVHQIKHRFTGATLFGCEVPDELASGMRVRHALEQAVKAGAYLTGADLAGANLVDADLAGANLVDADLAGADLVDAYLAGADLVDADLAGADLARADLARAYLTGADLAGANLVDAYLAGAYLAGADLAGADLAGAYLAGAYLAGANLADAYLAGANLADADLADAYLAGANLADANMAIKPASAEESIEALDKVRAIVLDDRERLAMWHWHGDTEWRERTCAEETICGTTHCMAGWLQVCATNPEIRKLDSAQLAGTLAAPIAAKMFSKGNAEALDWLESRQYVQDIAKHDKRVAELSARREAKNAQT